jgi:hypothetical protein
MVSTWADHWAPQKAGLMAVQTVVTKVALKACPKVDLSVHA